jgi:hypothetical protein
LKPVGGLPAPTFGEALISLRVLAVTAGCDGVADLPSAAVFVNSDDFAALKGKPAASSSVPNTFAVAASLVDLAPRLRVGPLMVDRADVLPLSVGPRPPRAATLLFVDVFLDCGGRLTM